MHILDLLLYFVLLYVIAELCDDDPIGGAILSIIFTILYLIVFVAMDYNVVDVIKSFKL
jgi:hypothetical protein